MIKIDHLGSNNEKAWDAYVNQHINASIYHLSLWRHIIKQQFGHDSDYLMATQEGSKTIVGVLPLVYLKSRLFGNFMVSMPYFNYGGVLADNELVEISLLDKARELGESKNVAHIEHRELKSRQGDWPCRDEKVLMQLGLPDSTGFLWKAIGAKRRAQIKRPDREGVSIRSGGLECLGDFYAVFSRNMRDLGTPVYAKQWFEAILRLLSNQASIIVVMINNQPAAAAFLVGYKHRLEIPWGSSLREYNRIGVNMRLYWEVLKYAIDNKYSVFDFGRSTIDESTYKFKKQWGAEPVQCFWNYQLIGYEDMPQLNPSNAKYAMAIKCWKKLPMAVANRLGPHIVKNLP